MVNPSTENKDNTNSAANELNNENNDPINLLQTTQTPQTTKNTIKDATPKEGEKETLCPEYTNRAPRSAINHHQFTTVR